MMKNKSVTIGWLDPGTVYTGFVAYICQILLHRTDKIDGVVVASGHYLSNNKNRIVELFLESKSEWLLLLDSDILVDLDNFDKLLESADKEKYPVMSGMYFIPMNENSTLVLAAMKPLPEDSDQGVWVTDWEDGQIIENLHSVGGGFTLIHRSVYEAIKEKNGFPQWYQDEYNHKSKMWISEDIYFFKMVRDLGINICLNTAVEGKHLKTFKLDKSNFIKTHYGLDSNNLENQHEHHHLHGNSYGSRKKRSWWVLGKPK